MEKKSIFRKAALNSLVNPEELNKLIYLGFSGSWVIVASIIGLIISCIIWSAFSSVPIYIDAHGIILNKSRLRPVMSGVEGFISEINVQRGDTIKSGDLLVKIKSSQDPNYPVKTITSFINGIITRKRVYPSLYVKNSDILFTVEEPNFSVNPKAIAYVPSDIGDIIQPGMDVHIIITNLNKNLYGFIRGKVEGISACHKTRELMIWDTGIPETVDYLVESNGNKKLFTSVLIRLLENKDGTFQWSQKKPPFTIETGSVCECFIIAGKKSPINTLFSL